MGFSSRCIPFRRGGDVIYRHRRPVSSSAVGSTSSLGLRVLDPRTVSSNSRSVLSWATKTTISVSPVSVSALRASSLSASSSPLTEMDTDRDLDNEKDGEDEEPFLEEDTIFALSSGFTGEQATAVAVIRISGPKANTVLEGLLKTSSSSKPRLPKFRMAALRKLYHPTDHSILDHALVLSFKGPNSFTGEDLVELQCHGSRVIVQRLLNEALPSLGCRLAEPGEFTQRAFAEGKLDLVQVEALADILAAETHLQVEQGLKHLDGEVSKTYEDWRNQLVSGLAHAEAVIDFGDDEHLLLGGEDEDDDDGLSDEALQQQQESVWGEVGTKMMNLKESMQDNLEDGRRGELIREGIKVAIIGPPNAGKSSLFNVLARRDAAIVSPIAGTTRDVLQVSMDLGGVKCTLQDTAGVRSDTTDILELEGMKRAKSVIQEADLVVAMVDVTAASHGMEIVQSVLEECNRGNNDDDDEGDDRIGSQRMLLVRNKNDLLEESAEIDGVQQEEQRKKFGDGIFDISCENQEGIDAFLDALTKEVVARTRGNADGGEGALITRARHRKHVEAAVMALERFTVLSTEGNMAVDMAAEELRLAASELGRITGAVDVEDVLDVLFSDFCIGK
eukprot:CAMPEP_0168193126 /NCGR_PEP_ID=MMETSP0139_2-20121125/18427_1 /TAXON_ID=44445 /ORGANISM="Pseudo-nitzschia australis, Strain 10249 10 AB" /LENGTH=617 /DNA_ID=CAMNT_0008116435 /DNA_START=194 /DNA_END=2047 /DNA_ORIENTATION=+